MDLRRIGVKSLNDLMDVSYFAELYIDKEWAREYLKDKNNFCIGLYDKNIPVGFLLANPVRTSSFYIAELMIDPDYTRMGFARLLMETFEKSIKNFATDIYLHVRTNNEKAIPLYNSLGYGVYRLSNQYYCKDIDAYYMHKDLHLEDSLVEYDKKYENCEGPDILDDDFEYEK